MAEENKTQGDRRQFLKLAAAGAASASLLGTGFFLGGFRRFAGMGDSSAPIAWDPLAHSPVAALQESDFTTQAFAGPDPKRGHGALWAKIEFLKKVGGLPEPTEEVPLVIVGGGMSGLLSAYLLREHRPVVLEQDPRMGGNSRGESWNELKYTIGACYIPTPAEDSDERRILTELGLWADARFEEPEKEAHFLVQNRLLQGFWNGASDSARAHEFKKAAALLLEISRKRFPEIPFVDSATELTREEFLRWDRMSLRDWLKENLAAKLHPHLAEYFRNYCWSSFGGGDEEISAAQGLNFVAADLDGLTALPGGNSAISQRLCERLAASLPTGHLRTRALTVDVRIEDQGVRVTYLDHEEKLRSIRARTCLVAAPKLVAKRVIEEMDRHAPGQREAMESLKYRAYLVANILVDRKVPSPGFEIFRLSERGKDAATSREASQAVPFTDVSFAGFAQDDRYDHSVLALFRGYPYEGARAELLADSAYSKARSEFESALPGLLSTFGISESSVRAVRIARWGHAMPLAGVGLLAAGIPQRASKPIQNRIYFAQQDNYANPAFESCLASAHEAARQLDKRLRS